MAFLTDDFLLKTKLSKRLYHDVASKMPIYDYHCHLDAKDIYADRRFENIADIWLSGDHYKWRLMRALGVGEEYITGDKPQKEKFRKFSECLPFCIGNPVYSWCHMELKNYFGYDGVLNGDTADEVWQIAGEKLKESSFSARGLIEKSNVLMIGTTDDPLSDLKYHKLLLQTDFSAKVCPTFRPDNILNIQKSDFASYMKKLSEVCGFPVKTVSDVKRAVSERLMYFVKCGCRSSDHGIDYVMFRLENGKVTENAFSKAINGKPLTITEIEAYQTDLLLHCAREYKRFDLVMQLHFSCARNTNSKKLKELGADTGFDCMAKSNSSDALYKLMDALESENSLPKTILYSLNPADNPWIDTLTGAFQSDEIAGKIQHGSAWWFNDNKDGIKNQLTSLANLGVLANFVGMLTDSRSFLSYARHEYFRRILCALIGEWVEDGEYPCDFEVLKRILEDICADNARRYFNV